MAVEGNYAEGVVALRRLGTQLEAQRGNLVAAAQLFSRISGCNAAILGKHCFQVLMSDRSEINNLRVLDKNVFLMLV